MRRTAEPTRTASSVEEYLKLEEESLERHEFVDGQMFAMADGTTRHNRIAGMLYAKLLEALREGDCEVFIENVKLRFPDGVHYYPDVMPTCDSSDRSLKERTSPCFLAEVLSESTAPIDHGEKLKRYLELPSLQTYVLLEQDAVSVEVYSRLPDGAWRYQRLVGGDALEVPCVNAKIPVSTLYRGVLEAT
jgi:Uma2 family endonuclease